ncbi:IS1096 element passenger TnpR family protein [Cryptosporangium phraense]|uniref:Plasmid pRiA4b ORF-3 family protein n=1 Tax=Cryptosporangium phraense TaxID=2593070 RepID=A0A545AQ30_9ACTN|nr:plasmid pRiA4b ORF-3 family protein [Cryptosporangium phraense]TQS42845.1 plasmid pRiA4b ORF-3 family protein [Cryptosporangium phraense]
MTHSWWSVRVELLGGGQAGELWPRPGRIFAVNPRHTFHVFAEAIDDAFARWDRSHLHEFTVPAAASPAGGDHYDDLYVTELKYLEDYEPDRYRDADHVRLEALLGLGDEFGYVFDLGDNWRHRCVIGDGPLDPETALGIVPARPLAYWGWGYIPDPYGRLFDGDDGEAPIPAPPGDDWPWTGRPAPTVRTDHCPGQYTHTLSLPADVDDDD